MSEDRERGLAEKAREIQKNNAANRWLESVVYWSLILLAFLVGCSVLLGIGNTLYYVFFA